MSGKKYDSDNRDFIKNTLVNMAYLATVTVISVAAATGINYKLKRDLSDLMKPPVGVLEQTLKENIDYLKDVNEKQSSTRFER